MTANDPSIRSVTVNYDPADETKEKVVTFFSGLKYWEPNMKFGTMEDKFRNAAALLYPRFIRPQMNTNLHTHLHDMFLEGVADFDCVKDYVTINHYPDLNNVGSAGSTGFSFEVWIRLRRLPERGSSAVILCKKQEVGSHHYCLTISYSGALSFVIQSQVKFEIKTEIEQIYPGFFYHVAITGAIGSSVQIIINGQLSVSLPFNLGITALPGHSDGRLFLGKDCTGGSLKYFCGQITAFYIYARLRTETEINNDKFKRSNRRGGTVGSYDFHGNDRLYVINYYITNKYLIPDEVPNNPSILVHSYDSSPVPLNAIVVGRKIIVIYQNTASNLQAREYTVSVSSESASLIEEQSWSISMGGISVNKGFFSSIYDPILHSWIIVVLDSHPTGKANWKMYDNDFVPNSHVGCEGSIILKNQENQPLEFDTHPDLVLKANHLIVSAGAKNTKSMFICDMLLRADGCSHTVIDTDVILPPIGPNSNDWGADYYVYLGNLNTGTGIGSYLRRKHTTISHPMTYEIEEVQINLSDDRPAESIDANTSSDDWSWFLFRISSPTGGAVLQSGQRVLVQTPDNENKGGWAQLKVENGTLKADNTLSDWNFIIFKVNVLSSDEFKVIPGEIFTGSYVALLPSSSVLYTTIKFEFYPLLSDAEVSIAKRELPEIFKPWKLLVPPGDASDRPLPAISEPPNIHHPASMQEGNRVTLLSESQGLDVPRIYESIWGGILNFARTVSAPAFAKSPPFSRYVHLIFRGDGLPSPIYTDSTTEEIPSNLLNDLYQEGITAQNHMSSGLFYSFEYIIPANESDSAKIGHLNHVQNLHTLEYPTPPSGFVWLVAPPFKVMGTTGEIAKFYTENTFSVAIKQNTAFLAFYEITKACVGVGTFGEGIFKARLTIPLNASKVNEISEDLQKQFFDRIKENVPQYDKDNSQYFCPDQNHTDTWCVLGEYSLSRALDATDTWHEKVDMNMILSKMKDEMQKQWVKDYISIYYDNYIDRYFTDDYKKYAAYGGFSKVVANNLLNPPTLKKIMDLPYREGQKVIQSQLKILHLLDPDIFSETMTSLSGNLLAYTAVLEVSNCLFELE